MSAEAETPVAAMKSLRDIETTKIDRNPGNPRLHFPEDELDRLAQSIAKEGILVPVVVYEDGDDRYRLVDGERRWLCAQQLGLPTVPAVIIERSPDTRDNLVRMFNIHMVREPWQDMPTAWALGKLIEETGVTSNRELSDLTGLSGERIERLRHALELPKDYQTYIDEGRIPLNFFWELKKSVIDPLAKRRPSLWAEFGESEVLDSFVTKRLNLVVTDAVSLRKVNSIISIAAREVEEPSQPSVLDEAIRRLIRDEAVTIEEAYQDTVEVVVESDKLERRTDNVLKSFERLLDRVRTPEERQHVIDVGRRLVDRLGRLLGLAGG
jgi:ParB family transcriptional regulator, chromosome partitioning protein